MYPNLRSLYGLFIAKQHLGEESFPKNWLFYRRRYIHCHARRNSLCRKEVYAENVKAEQHLLFAVMTIKEYVYERYVNIE